MIDTQIRLLYFSTSFICGKNLKMKFIRHKHNIVFVEEFKKLIAIIHSVA